MVPIDQIKQLRDKLPVGLKAAERYLEATNGSVAKAAHLYHTDMVNLFISKMQSTEDDAERFLLASHYDLGRAMENYEREKYTHVEYVIRHTKGKKQTLHGIYPHISTTLLTNNSLPEYPESYSIYKSFVRVMDWVYYYGWEGDLLWDSDRDKEVIDVLENVLHLPLLAEKMKIVRNRFNELYKQTPDVTEIWKDPCLKESNQSLIKYFDSHYEELISTVYDFVVKNLHLFTF